MEAVWQSDRTPAELVHWAAVSPNGAMRGYLARLAARHPQRLTLETIGRSALGQNIPVLHAASVQVGDAAKPVVLIFAQQHGDEPAGMEACLLLARNAAAGLADALDLWIVPQVNPDGAQTGSRRDSLGRDLNRGHLRLDTPEQRALYRLFHRVQPDVTIDLHEFDVERNAIDGGAALSAYDVMADGPTNPNVAGALRRLGQRALTALRPDLAARGYRFGRYVRGDPFSQEAFVVRPSTLRAFDGRNVPALFGSLAFIIEATRHADDVARLQRRTLATHAATTALLDFCAAHADRIIETVAKGRHRRQKRSRRPIVLSAEYRPRRSSDRLTYAFMRPETGEIGERVSLLATMVPTALRKRELPAYYWLDLDPARPSHARVLDALAGHQISVTRLPIARRAKVESLVIEGMTQSAGGGRPRVVQVRSRIKTKVLPAGALLVPTDQPGGQPAGLLLEPESMDGLLASLVWRVRKGRRYPIRRVLRFRRAEAGSESGSKPEREA